MIRQRQYIKSENPSTLAASFCSLGRRSSSSSLTAVEMPMKVEERLNELESNAVKALLSLGEAFVSQSPYCAAAKKQPDPIAYVRPLQPLQQSQTTRTVIVKAEPAMPKHEEPRNQCQLQQQQTLQQQRSCSSATSIPPNASGHSQYVRELGPVSNGLNFSNHQSTIRVASSNAPPTPVNQKGSTTTTIASPVSIQPVVSAVSSSSPVISTIFYQIPATAASTTNGNNGTVMSPSFTIIPAHNGRTVIPLPMVTTNTTPLVKIEPSTIGAQNNTTTSVNWNNIQLLKVPRSSIENGNGLATFSTLAPALTNSTPATKLLPSPGRGEGKPLSVMPDGKSPTKSRARRRSQSTSKGQSRSSRVSSSSSSEFIVCPSVEGLPNILVDGYEISREIWAKAFLQNDIIHAAGTLFNALFSSEEIKNCTLNGRNGTRQLCPEKRHAIFKIVAWMKNKCQDPYSFNKSPEDTKVLNREEQMMIEKKVFVERRYQTSRKIRDLPPAQQSSLSSTLTSSIVTTIASSGTPSKSPINSTNACAKNNQKVNTSVPGVPMPALIQQRRDSGSFSSVCSSSGDDKGIPKIALIQSSEIIANYFQSADPLPLTTSTKPLLTNHSLDGPPPLKMQKVG